MHTAPSRSSWMAVAVIAAAPLVAPAGEAHRKPAAAHPDKAAQAAAGAQQRAMIHQQAALQRQAVAQQHLATRRQAAAQQQQGLNPREGVVARPHATDHPTHHLGTGHVGGSGINHNANTGAMVASLHSVVGKLHQADHDYDGHRVQAIRQLEQALHTLHNGTHRVGNGVLGTTGVGGRAGGARLASNRAGVGGGLGAGAATGMGTGTGKGPRLSQAESDAHLRQAHGELQALEGRMSGMGTGMAPHHRQAHGHIQQALQHLNTALATR